MVELPDVTEDDIAWACAVLGLPPRAFSGVDGTDPRQEILCNNTTLDVEACPGSGKTTLLVAKLAILARHWKSSDQGICVISHTNAARREIEKKLGSTSEGQRLLSYPHYVGTIHGFVNEYLALPWLRSKGGVIKAIDDDLCLQWRWGNIPRNYRFAIEQRRKGPNVARYQDSDHTPKHFGFSENSATYQSVREACEASTEAGFYCHEEMFVWASELLELHSESIDNIRSRFPVLFIDEVQDNSAIQSDLLHRLFVDGNNPVIRQRFGDQNQAIYDYSGVEGAVTDIFPEEKNTATIPNSHRFGQSIADLANPFAIVPHGLVGQGGNGPNGENELAGKHVVILFEDTDVAHVLPAYARIIRESISAEELVSGSFTAVAAVHKTDASDHIPRSVRHYWTDYDPEVARSNPQPNTMLQFVRAAQNLSETTGEYAEAVETFAKGIIKLSQLMNKESKIAIRRFKHRYAIELLSGDEARIYQYQDIVSKLVINRYEPTQAEWEGEFSDSFFNIAQVMSGVANTTSEAWSFLRWLEAMVSPDGAPNPINVMYDGSQDPPITVRLGSIHSVKGETHTTTLVLESYNRAHHLNALKPWLLGRKFDGIGQRAAMLQRLKLHYVAMTRPQRLLCLAMRSDSWSLDEIGALKARGWRVGLVSRDGTEFQ